MADYIDRDAFLKAERDWYCKDCDRRKNSKGKTVYDIGGAPCRSCGIGDVLDLVEDYPAADVRPVVHGEWIGKPIAGFCTVRCSVCDEPFLENNGTWNFCPNCGADMRGIEDGETN